MVKQIKQQGVEESGGKMPLYPNRKYRLTDKKKYQHLKKVQPI